MQDRPLHDPPAPQPWASSIRSSRSSSTAACRTSKTTRKGTTPWPVLLGIHRYTEAQTVGTQRLLPFRPVLGMSESATPRPSRSRFGC